MISTITIHIIDLISKTGKGSRHDIHLKRSSVVHEKNHVRSGEKHSLSNLNVW